MQQAGLNPWVGKISLKRKWQLTPVFLPGESQGWGSLVGCHLWGLTELDMTEATKQQQHSILGTTKIKALVKSISLR